MQEVSAQAKPTENKPTESVPIKQKAKITTETVETAAKLAEKELGKSITVPVTAYGFEIEYNSVKWDDSLLHQFIKAIPFETYQNLFKNTAIQADIFSHVVKVLITKEDDIDFSI